MALKQVHFRVSKEEYDFLCALAKEMNCSQAAIIRTALFHSDMKDIVQRYRDMLGDAYLQRYITCGLNREDEELIASLIQELNQNTQQLRKIGTNLSSFLRDTRNGFLFFRTPQERQQFEILATALLNEQKKAMAAQTQMAEQASATFSRTSFKVKINTRKND